MSERPLSDISWLGLDDAAERLGWTENDVLAAIDAGDLPAIRIPSVTLRIPERAVDDLAAGLPLRR
jgi:hypothetical protein